MSAPYSVTSPSTGLPVFTVDGNGNTIQTGTITSGDGVALTATPSPSTPSAGDLKIYSPDGSSLWSLNPNGQKTLLSGTGSGGGPTDWFNVATFGATGNGITDDTAAIQAALNAANTQGGGTVYLPWGNYLISAPLSMPPYTWLLGQTDITLNFFNTATIQSRLIIAPGFTPSAAGGGAIQFLSQTPGGWSIPAASSGLRNIFIDGSQCSNTNVQGVNFKGPVYDTHLDNVFIWKSPHDGITASGQSESGIGPTFPYHQRYFRVTCANSGFIGFNLTNMTDSLFSECMAFASGGNGYQFQNNSNCLIIGCKSEWSTGRNYDVTGSSGSMVFSGCEADAGYSDSFRIHSATGQGGDGGGIIIVGGKHHGSGLNGGGGDYGIHITASTVPIIISGINVEATNGSLGAHPAIALEIDTSSNVNITSCILQGISSAYTDGGGNTNIIRKSTIGMTGNPGSQTTALLDDLPYPNTWQPTDNGWIASAFELGVSPGTTSATNGILYLIRVNIRSATSVTNIVYSTNNSATNPISGQNWLGVYSSTGSLLGQTEVSGSITTAGTHSVAITGGPISVSPPFIWIAMLFNCTGTVPNMFRGLSTAGNADGNQSNANYRFAVNGTGLIQLPPSITPANNTTSGATAFWAAVS